jgi:hypothetical protein
MLEGELTASLGIATRVVSGSPAFFMPNGSILVDQNSESLYFRVNNQWVAAGTGTGSGNASLTVSDTPPASPEAGDLWFESDTGKVFVYYDSFWIETGGGGATGVATDLSELGDVALSTLANGDVLRYNSSASVWTNDPINLSTDTIGDYVASLTAGTGIAISNNSGEASSPTISIESTAWTSYTPTITADGGGFALNNGTLTGRYKQVGKTVFFNLKFVFGSTTSAGTGHWNFSLPVTAYDSNFTFSAAILDDGVAWYGGIGNGNYTGSTSSFAVIIPGTNASVTTWASVG